jgi:hypothetical protein
VDELMMSLGSLLTNEDLAAFLANLPQQRDEPLLVDIYELYQEILARYQTRLHSDERVWDAEIVNIRAQEALNAHITEYGESLDCSGNIEMTDAAVCQRRAVLESEADTAMQAYIDAVVEVNNEMIDAGMMTLMDADVSRRTQSLAARLFAATTIATIGTLVPLTLEDAAIDAATYGLGRIRRIGPALERALDRIREAGRVGLDWVLDISNRAVQRVVGNRREQLISELSSNGIRHTPEDIVSISRASDGTIVFLERGTSRAGLQHIVAEHGDDFARRGITEEEIPDAIMAAVTRGHIVGTQGESRPIYEVFYNGRIERIAVTVGSNGFIVGANPAR